jgi:hypothetical protein
MLKFSPTDKKRREDQATVASGFHTYPKKKEKKDHACTEKELLVVVVRLYRYADLRDFGVD